MALPRTIFLEMLELIAKYDWATEGFPAPEGNELSREDAVKIRNKLVEATRDLVA